MDLYLQIIIHSTFHMVNIKVLLQILIIRPDFEQLTEENYEWQYETNK